MSDESKLYYGVTIWFNSSRGFGFVQWDDDGVAQPDMFVHYSDILVEGYKTLFKGQRVSFNIGKNNNGDPKATNVKILLN